MTNMDMYKQPCPDYIIALLRALENQLDRVMWNNNQEQYESPFENTGNSYLGKHFQVKAYDWENNDVNFKCGLIEITWYKHLGRDTTINGKFSSELIIKAFDTCLKEIISLEND